jgi:hypothetical protein
MNENLMMPLHFSNQNFSITPPAHSSSKYSIFVKKISSTIADLQKSKSIAKTYYSKTFLQTAFNMV